jgi:hypothetical protein
VHASAVHEIEFRRVRPGLLDVVDLEMNVGGNPGAMSIGWKTDDVDVPARLDWAQVIAENLPPFRKVASVKLRTYIGLREVVG